MKHRWRTALILVWAAFAGLSGVSTPPPATAADASALEAPPLHTATSDSPAVAAAPLPAPLGPGATVTSSFGEYRAAHYHAGVDYSTGGRPGLPVAAPAAGWVYRVRASGVGYGRALYYRLDDGRTMLYGHLSAFHPRIEEAVEAEQDRLGEYEIDLYPGPDSLRFETGEVIAYTGSSGAGPAHLHAELRVGPEASVAVNPAVMGWAVPDTIAPTLTRLRVEPAAPGAAVDGGLEPVTVRLDTTAPSVEVAGRVRVWVEAGDRTEAGSGRLAPYRLLWSVDGAPIAETRLDEVDWRWPREVKWTFEQALARTENERWIAMDPPPGSRQRISRWLTEEPFTWDLEPGEHVLRIEAFDAAGNRTVREVFLRYAGRVRATPRIPEFAESRVVSRGYRLDLVLNHAAGGFEGPHLMPAYPHQRVTAPVASVGVGWTLLGFDTDRVRAVLYLDPLDRPGLVHSVVPRADGSADSASALWVEPTAGWAGSGVLGDRGISLDVEPGDVYEPMWILMRWTPGATRSDPDAPELIPVSSEVSMEPWAYPLREPIGVALPTPDGRSRKGLALYSWDDGWHFEGADTSGHGVAGTIGNLETLALLRDDTPPVIALQTNGRRSRPNLRARITDGGSGLSRRDLTMTLDGRPVIAEWDPDRLLLIAHLRHDLPPGEHSWTVTAVDRVGNRAQASTLLVVP